MENFNSIRLLARVVIAEAFHEARNGMSKFLKKELATHKDETPVPIKDPKFFITDVTELEPWARFAEIPVRKLLREADLIPEKRKTYQRKFKVK